MADSPPWLPGHLGLAALCYTIRFLMLGIDTPDVTDGDGSIVQVFNGFVAFVAFQLTGVPDWVNFVFFVMIPLPLIVHIAHLTFSNTATTIIGLVGAAIGGIISFFT